MKYIFIFIFAQYDQNLNIIVHNLVCGSSELSAGRVIQVLRSNVFLEGHGHNKKTIVSDVYGHWFSNLIFDVSICADQLDQEPHWLSVSIQIQFLSEIS